MAETEKYKWAVEQHLAISELSERMAARGGILAKLGAVFSEYAERIMRENLRNSERMRYQHTMIARTAAHGDDTSWRRREPPPAHKDAY